MPFPTSGSLSPWDKIPLQYPVIWVQDVPFPEATGKQCNKFSSLWKGKKEKELE